MSSSSSSIAPHSQPLQLVVLCVRGSVFYANAETVYRSQYLRELWDNFLTTIYPHMEEEQKQQRTLKMISMTECVVLNSARPIFIDRSSRMFEHVLSLLSLPNEFDLYVHVHSEDVRAFAQELQFFGVDLTSLSPKVQDQLKTHQAIQNNNEFRIHLSRSKQPYLMRLSELVHVPAGQERCSLLSHENPSVEPHCYSWIHHDTLYELKKKGYYALHIDTDAFLVLINNAKELDLTMEKILDGIQHPIEYPRARDKEDMEALLRIMDEGEEEDDDDREDILLEIRDENCCEPGTPYVCVAVHTIIYMAKMCGFDESQLPHVIIQKQQQQQKQKKKQKKKVQRKKVVKSSSSSDDDEEEEVGSHHVGGDNSRDSDSDEEEDMTETIDRYKRLARRFKEEEELNRLMRGGEKYGMAALTSTAKSVEDIIINQHNNTQYSHGESPIASQEYNEQREIEKIGQNEVENAV